ncbi:hypothetical protein CFOL_v3_01792, partial [Cephalotus follicularis]
SCQSLSPSLSLSPPKTPLLPISLLFSQLNADAASLFALLPVKRLWNSRSAGKSTTKLLLFIVSPSLTQRKYLSLPQDPYDSPFSPLPKPTQTKPTLLRKRGEWFVFCDQPVSGTNRVS